MNSNMKPLAGTSFLEQFSASASQNPLQTAVQDNSRKLSYEDLNKVSAHIAARLRALGLGCSTTPDQYDINHPEKAQVSPWIMIHTQRTVDIALGILGVLRAGGAYICVPSGAPSAYVRQIMEDANVSAILTDEPDLECGGTPCIRFSHPSFMETADPDLVKASMAFIPRPLDMATAIFTSGSTGRPKGAVLEQRAITAMLEWQQSYMDIGPGSHTAAFAPFGFIASPWELLFPLASGMTLHILDEDLRRDPLSLDQYFRTHAIRYVFFSPEMAELFSHNCQGESLRYVRVAGGPLGSCPHTPYEILYSLGMSENGGSVTFLSIQQAYERDIPLGRAFGPTRIYLVDDENKLVAKGEKGQMAVSSPSLARGYLGMPDKNQAVFISNPHKGTPSVSNPVPDGEIPHTYDRLFISGDLARVDTAGNLRHCGRKDFVVKIRGMRVDPGHTEAVLAGYQGVEECVVKGMADRQGEHYLLAWAGGKDLAPEILKSYLAENLPDYMVPEHILVLEKLPRGVHGKIDRENLPPLPVAEAIADSAETSSELSQICGIFSDILNRVIRPLDNFFAHGGDSLKLVRLQLRLRRDLAVDLSYQQLFRSPSPSKVLEITEKAQKGKLFHIPPSQPREHYPLTMPMRQMYLLWRLGTAPRSYEVDACMMVEGEIEAHRIQRAFTAMVNKESILRSQFSEDGGEVIWKILETLPFTLKQFTADDPEEARQIWARLNQERPPFDLTRPPLFCAAAIHIGLNRCFLGLSTHHILVDAAAIRFLMDGWWHFYTGLQTHDPQLGQPAKMTDYALWDRERQNRPNPSETFWEKEFNTPVPPLDLAGASPRPQRLTQGSASVYAAVEKEGRQAMTALAERVNASEFQIIMAVWTAFLSRQAVFTKGFDEIVLGVPFVGRDHPDLQYCVGMFVRTLPLRFAPDPDGSQPFSHWLAVVRDSFLTAWEHQSCSLERIVQLVNPVRTPGRSPMYDVMINRLPMARPFPVLVKDKRETTARMVPGTSSNTALFDLVLETRREKDRDILELKYARDLFQKDLVQTWADALVQILRAAVSSPDIHLKELPWPGKELCGQEIPNSLATMPSRADWGKETPRTAALSLAWENILGTHILGPEDDFFEHGGDSIKAMGLEGELFKAGWYLPATQIYETARFGELAPMMEPAEYFDEEDDEFA